jgi:hypothetical protein
MNENIAGSNKAVLDDAFVIQQKTKEALQRIQQEATETEFVGSMALFQLEELVGRTDRALESADELTAKLKSTESLQNKFGRWKLRFNRRAARIHAKAERRQVEVGTYRKTREHETIEASLKIDKEDANAERMELFTDRKKPLIKNEAPNDACEDPLSGEDQLHLDNIQETDKDIDSALDVVANQLNNLLDLSKSLGTATQSQNRKLDELDQKLAKADYKQKVVNHRSLLFLQ